jgi:gamma-glutamyltranspeptidase/glutathione hydrolase
MTTGELVREARMSKHSLDRRAALAGMSLSGISLSGISLAGMSLAGMSLVGTGGWASMSGLGEAALCMAEEARPKAAESPRAMVATVHPLATEAGLAALRAGGNAVDAAIAAAVTLGVVDGHNSGLGGGSLLLIRAPDGSVHALDGREMAPARAHRDMYVRDGKLDAEASQTGPLAVAVPGALAVYAEALERFGKRRLAEVLEPAAALAENGFALDRVYAAKLAANAAKIARFPGSKAVLLRPDGQAFGVGETLRQPDLARTYRAIAAEGPEWFYGGPFARSVGQWMAENGGVLSTSDFGAYRVRRREPLTTTYRGHSVIGFPPPSSGGVHVAQMLAMLEPIALAETYRRDPAEWTHVVAEAMKRAFADRAHWLGDPDFARVPRGLIDKAYAESLGRTIDPKRATRVAGHGMPPRADEDVFEKHTTHVAAADASGYWVALTTTVNTTFGSKVIVPGTGVILNNEMDDFSAQPGQPNAFGLVGAEANAVAPGKRPLSSMSPTIVLRDKRPIMTVGAAGGPTIISQVLIALLRRLDLEAPLEECLGGPRFHHQWAPDELRLERSTPQSLQDSLRSRGHTLKLVDGLGVSQAITWDAARGVFQGVSDPRVPGLAAGPQPS